jgi:hypothetical protein
MRVHLLSLALVLPLVALATPSTASASTEGGLFTDAAGAFPADFSLSGACNGAATLTVTIHRPAGDDVRSVAVTSSAIPTCGGGLRCLDCPPVPEPMVWTMKGDGVLLAGGGAAAYEQYNDWPLAWSLQGPFQEGVLELHGVLD